MPTKKTVKVSTLKFNPNNPSVTIKEKFPKLVKSIEDFPQMMTIREIIVDENNITLGGNKRLSAIHKIIELVKEYDDFFSKDQKLRKILLKDEIPADWVKVISCLTERQKLEFSVKDNIGFGLWDWDVLSDENFFDPDELDDWGIDIPVQKDYSSEGSEADDADELDDKMKITLEYTFEDYQSVKEELSNRGETAERALFNYLFP